jgi:hypothetical protein
VEAAIELVIDRPEESGQQSSRRINRLFFYNLYTFSMLPAALLN